MKRFTVRLTQSADDFIRLQAKNKKIKPSDYLRYLLDLGIKAEEKAEENITFSNDESIKKENFFYKELLSKSIETNAIAKNILMVLSPPEIREERLELIRNIQENVTQFIVEKFPE